MAWTDWLMGKGALNKAAKTGDAGANTPAPAEPIPNYVEDAIKATKPAPAPSTPGPKKQPRVGFPPKKKADDDSLD